MSSEDPSTSLPATPPGGGASASDGLGSPPAETGNDMASNNSSNGFLSAPSLSAYSSPLRQHRRTPSQHREVKETLNAVSEFADNEDSGQGHHTINQYTLHSIIGRGSYGAVHRATDQYGKEYAIKEFSKARLRKHLRYSIMKKGPTRSGEPDASFSSPSMRLSRETQAEAKDSLHLIRKEIAIMKKLNHPNLVALIEVLDDPEQDSLYMVLEMCKKGVIMNVGLNKKSEPYSSEACRCWFRDLMLGIEYLHAQNIIHRDIKPDNLLVTEDDMLKIGDFGVSEMFEKADGMRTNKQAGSPAFLPPELCASNHGDVAGPACDIWSMGVTLYCLRYGNVPFEHDNVPDTYNAITNETVALPEGEDETFVDLKNKILEKDPSKRITMSELRNHPWVTLHGSDPLLSAEENCANPVEPPSALELNHAITQRMTLFCVLKAIAKFKALLHPNKRSKPGQSDGMDSQQALNSETGITEDEVARLVAERRYNIRKASQQSGILGPVADEVISSPPVLVLGIGVGGRDDEFGADAEGDQGQDGVVSESPTAAGFDVYDRAFQSEVERIRTQAQNRQDAPAVYLTRLIEQTHGSASARRRYLNVLGDKDSEGDKTLVALETSAVCSPMLWPRP